jgi:hypothetical protein
MLETFIAVFSIFGLAFAVKETEGPWGLMSWIRNQLIKNKYVGVFFYKLLSCFYCTGFWAGLGIYFLTQEAYKLTWALCWGLAGGAICVILDALLSRLYRE